MTYVAVYHRGRPGGPEDKKIERIIGDHGGQVTGAGTLLVGPHAGQRDVGGDVPPGRVDACCQVLRQAGFTKIEVS